MALHKAHDVLRSRPRKCSRQPQPGNTQNPPRVRDKRFTKDEVFRQGNHPLRRRDMHVEEHPQRLAESDFQLAVLPPRCFPRNGAPGPPGPGRNRPEILEFAMTTTIRNLPGHPWGGGKSARTSKIPRNNIDHP